MIRQGLNFILPEDKMNNLTYKRNYFYLLKEQTK